MADHLRSGLVITAAFVAGSATAVLWWPGALFFALVAAYVVAHMVTLPGASGRRVSLSIAVAGTTALLSGGSLVLVLGPAAVALPIGRLSERLRSGERASRDGGAELAGTVVFAAAFAAATVVLPLNDLSHPAVLPMFGAAAAIGFLVTVATSSFTSSQRDGVAIRLVTLRALQDWPAYAALFSSAALFAVTVDDMGVWSVPLAGLPYIFSYVSLHRLQDTRRTYDQTIRALGAIPEASGQVATGHTSRTAELAVAVGAEMGLGAAELTRLEYAALLHDIGRVVLANPAVARDDYSKEDVSGWSAAIIGEARYLEDVAGIVASQHAPYRKEGQVRDQTVPRSSQILRIAASYDHSVGDGLSPLDAVELLHLGAAYEFDPVPVTALRQVLDRRGTLALLQ